MMLSSECHLVPKCSASSGVMNITGKSQEDMIASTGCSAFSIVSIAREKLPTLVVQEGGYIPDHLADGVCRFLRGLYEGATKPTTV
jgi:hypothetical protein